MTQSFYFTRWAKVSASKLVWSSSASTVETINAYGKPSESNL